MTRVERAPWADLLTAEELAYSTVEAARAGRDEAIPSGVHPALVARLAVAGVERVWRHQAETWEAVERGGDVIVTTGTASGKSLAFNLPVLSAIADDHRNRVLYVYPTKALAQDQARALTRLATARVAPGDLRR